MTTAIESRHRRLNPSLFPLEDMVEESIEFLREHEPPEGYFVGFSGGKDSIVTLELCRMVNVKHLAFYSVTGIDPLETVKFIRQEYPQVIFLKPPIFFWEGIRRKSPPLRMMRWCCDILKKQPARPAIIKELVGAPLLHRLMGIRSEESYRRAARPRINTYSGATVYKPIFDWKEWHIWDFIDEHHLKYPSLYDEDFHRIGCVVCPFIMGPGAAAQKRLEAAKARWPGIYRTFERVVTDWYCNHSTKKKRYREQTPAEYLAAYYRGFQ